MPSKAVDLEKRFRKLGVKSFKPGFYDDQAFMEAERSNPKLLEEYAKYVSRRPNTDIYEANTRDIVSRLLNIIDEATANAPRGSCRDSAAVLSRMLDRLGVWNFTVQGSFNIAVDGMGDEGRRFLWFDDELDPGAGVRGHQWVVAPPYRILDASVRWQGWKDHVSAAISGPIATEEASSTKIRAVDVYPEKVLFEAKVLHGLSEAELLKHYRPDVKEFYGIVPPLTFRRGAVEYRYIPVGITASEEPLEDIAGTTLRPKEIWDNVVVSEFAEQLSL